MTVDRPIRIATRGSALALAQAQLVLGQCQRAFPQSRFELKIIKTTGDRLQTASLAQEGGNLPKGLFTKELEVALGQDEADLAVHSLKDLPTSLPSGLKLGAVTQRADVRDVLIYRDAQFLAAQRQPAAAGVTAVPSPRRGFAPQLTLQSAVAGLVIGTSSTRRQAQIQAARPDLKIVPIRGNVVTRVIKLAEQPEWDALVLAWAGLQRLDIHLDSSGALRGEGIPEGLRATVLDLNVMLPCVGQGALGIEIREQDPRMETVCAPLNHFETAQCVTAERMFLSAMGGGCQSPVAAFAEVRGDQIWLRANSFAQGELRRAEGKRPVAEAGALGKEIAERLRVS